MQRPVKFGVTLPQIKRTWAEARDAAARVRAARLRLALGVRPPLRRAGRRTIPILEAWIGAGRGGRGHRARRARYAGHAAVLPQSRGAREAAGHDRPHRRRRARRSPGSARAGSRTSSRATAARSRPVRERLRALDETLRDAEAAAGPSEPATFEGRMVRRRRRGAASRSPTRRRPILVGGGGEQVLMGIAARHADIWNNLAVHQGELAHKVDGAAAALRGGRARPRRRSRSPSSARWSIAEDEADGPRGARQGGEDLRRPHGRRRSRRTASGARPSR